MEGNIKENMDTSLKKVRGKEHGTKYVGNGTRRGLEGRKAKCNWPIVRYMAYKKLEKRSKQRIEKIKLCTLSFSSFQPKYSFLMVVLLLTRTLYFPILLR